MPKETHKVMDDLGGCWGKFINKEIAGIMKTALHSKFPSSVCKFFVEEIVEPSSIVYRFQEEMIDDMDMGEF